MAEIECIKVRLPYESPWARVIKRNANGTILCVIDNDLCATDKHGLKYKDEITVRCVGQRPDGILLHEPIPVEAKT